MPDILSHPWLHTPQKSTPFVEQLQTELAITQLPPSPSTLARPITSPSLIDPELLASLRVIWGRHTDANGDSIKKDLCSPAGQGVHAKAFYFLLTQYREESMRNNLDTNKNDLDGDLDLGSAKFNLGWELDMSTVNKKYEGVRNNLLFAEAPSHPRPRSPATMPVSGLVLPAAYRAGTAGGARERATSPAGPRAQPQAAGRNGIEIWRSQIQVVDDWKTKPSINTPQPVMPNEPARGLRPTPSRRGYTYSHLAPEKAVSTVQFPKQLNAQDIVNLQCRSSITGPVGARRMSMFVTSPNPSIDKPDLPMAAIPTPTTSPIGSPVPSIYAPVPIFAPKSPLDVNMMIGAPEDMDKEMTNELLETEVDVVSASSPKPSPNPNITVVQNASVAQEPPTATRAQRPVSVSQGSGDKENQSVGEESWSYVEPEEPKARGLGLGVAREAARTMGNVTNAPLPAKGKEKKEKKIRPPTLDFRNLHQKRPTVLGSPILLSPPAASPTSSSRLMTSPVVGEFKGWFSNLFNWKHHVSIQGGVLYSANNISRTRADVGRILEGLGVVVENGGFDRGMTQADFTRPLKCRVEDPSGTRTPYTLKAVRFRIEFSVAPTTPRNTVSSTQPNNPELLAAPTPVHDGSSANGNGQAGTGALLTPRMRSSILMSGSKSHVNTPVASPLLSTEFPFGSTCAVYMAYEKGSVSSFRIIWRRLKEVCGGGAVAAMYPSCSPAMVSTPMVEHSERLEL
ncbi:hypothetical protein H0H87_007736 [Tephrocybe sp. NHM501043]|nr:hypothetical protein H0H87_007736 [Tephrocybe sp. NHM501043]